MFNILSSTSVIGGHRLDRVNAWPEGDFLKNLRGAQRVKYRVSLYNARTCKHEYGTYQLVSDYEERGRICQGLDVKMN